MPGGLLGRPAVGERDKDGAGAVEDVGRALRFSLYSVFRCIISSVSVILENTGDTKGMCIARLGFKSPVISNTRFECNSTLMPVFELSCVVFIMLSIHV